MTRHTTLPILILVVAPFAMAGPEGPGRDGIAMPRVLDLPAARSLALEHSPALGQLRERIHEQDGFIKEVRSSRLPRLNASGSYVTYDADRQQSFGEGVTPDDTRWQADAEVALYVFSGGRATQTVKSEQQKRASTTFDIAARQQQLLLDLHVAYLDACLAEQTIGVREEAIALFEEQLRLARNRVRAGAGTRFDVVQADVALANARPPLIRASNDRRTHVDRISQIIGLPFPEGEDAATVQILPVESAETDPLDLDASLRAAMAQRPEVKQLAARAASEQHARSAIRRERAPLVDVFASYGAESDQFGGGDPLEGWMSGVRVSVPLADGGKVKGRVQQSAARQRQLAEEHSELKQAIGAQVRQAFYDHAEARSILKASTLAIEQAKEALRLATNRFEAGKSAQLDVLESQLQLTRARLEYVAALNSAQLAVVRMRHATGEAL